MSSRTVRDLLRESSLLLKDLSGDLSILEARLLLCHVLDCQRSDLISDPARILSPEQAELYSKCIDRRLKGEPIAKICGMKEFWGLDFKVTQATLDPRPDTETLIEAVLEYAEPRSDFLRILDLGAGTGCILLSLLNELKDATGLGVDFSKDALEVAHENALMLGLKDRVSFLLSDWGGQVTGAFDIITSNPPYITEADYWQLSAQVRNFEPKTALVGGDDGLECYRKIAPVIDKHLALNGFFAIEIGINQEHDVSLILNENNLSVLEIRKDLAGILRCIIGRRLSR